MGFKKRKTHCRCPTYTNARQRVPKKRSIHFWNHRFNTRLNAHFFVLMTVVQLTACIVSILQEHDVIEGDMTTSLKSTSILGCSVLMMVKTVHDFIMGIIRF